MKFGTGSIMRASFLKQPIENMAGGHPEGKLPAPEISAAEGITQNWEKKEKEE